VRASRGRAAAIAAIALIACAAPPARALKLATWNVIDYPTTNLAGRQPYLRTVVAALDPDVIIMQELKSQAGADSFTTNVLNVAEPGQWAATVFFTSCESAMFYKPAKLTLTFAGSAIPTAGPRDVLVCRFKPVGYLSSSTEFRIYSAHFKAGGPATADSSTRRLECTDLRNSMNLAPAGSQILVGGDTNFYGSWEGGYIRLTESQSDNDGRMLDPNPISGTWNSSTYRFHHSQSTCLSGCASANYSTGGLDDKFDFWMSSYNLQDGQGLDILPGYSFPYGNDGQHYNAAVNGSGFNNAVGITVANALFQASDHLPAIIQLQLPSMIAAASQLDFGSVIVGATAQQSLAVSDPAPVPADALNYSFVAPVGFTAPGGSFSVAAGAAPNLHTIDMSTASAGTRTGTLTITTDAPDSLSKTVKLSGVVLTHAVASLESTVTVVEDSLDFGSHNAGEFADSMVCTHNRGYGSLQARLAVNTGTIVGGDGRFSLVGGFTPALVAGKGEYYTVHFDGAGATPDSTYEATLSFTDADEPLPGATAAASLVVHLVARVKQGNVDVEPGAPVALRFYAPRPNPLSHQTRFAFDLPQSAPVSLEVFDLTGRRVARVISGELPAGHHEVGWNAGDERGGPLRAGLYFARFGTRGLTRATRLVLLP
jgi:endonuclease/exonuclease/phosphatase family metal-dependent hydrolase